MLSPSFYNYYYVYLYRFSSTILLLLFIYYTLFKELLRTGLILSPLSFSITLSSLSCASSVLLIFFYSFYTYISVFAIRFKEDIWLRERVDISTSIIKRLVKNSSVLEYSFIIRLIKPKVKVSLYSADKDWSFITA